MVIALTRSQMHSENARIEPFERVCKADQQPGVNLDACQGELAVLGHSCRSFLHELEKFAVNLFVTATGRKAA
jgi:hypothetical protein